jgi:small subunit ribosomal protein S16
MLVIRLQRTGRKGHAMFRVLVQDSRRTPTSGKVVALLGSYDPHSKTITIDKEKASFYLEHGAQPSERTAYLLQSEGVKLPDWVKTTTVKKSEVKNPDKRRSTRPPEPQAEAPAVEEPQAEEPAVVEETTEPETPAPTEEAKAEEPEATVEPEPAKAESNEEPAK